MEGSGFISWMGMGSLSLGLFGARLFGTGSNFSPLLALCLGLGFVSQGRWYGFLIPVLVMATVDGFLGFYPGWAFTYVPLVFIVFMGVAVRGWSSVLFFSLGSSLCFFLISNGGVWLSSGLYPLTFQGLLECYRSGLPFFKNTLTSTLLFSPIVFSLLFGLPRILVQRARSNHLEGFEV